MYMSDWVAKLDDFLKLSGRELLTHAGTVSRKGALVKAQVEYERHRAQRINLRSPAETRNRLSSGRYRRQPVVARSFSKNALGDNANPNLSAHSPPP